MRDRWPELARYDARALVISFAPVSQLAGYRAMLDLTFPIAADPDRRAYQAYGMTRGSAWRIWGPRSAWAYAKLLARGWRLQRTPDRQDLAQLGGDFVVDAAGILRFVHVSRDPADRPPVDALLDALAAPASTPG